MVQIAKQSGIIPYRLESGSLQVRLITSRETGRWVIPKGNIGKGRNARDAAEREAYEEAGLKGHTDDKPLGSYTYDKVMDGGTLRPTIVEVFAMRVQKVEKKWPEKAERHCKWMVPMEAAKKVQEPGLAALFLLLAKRHLSLDKAAA